MIPHSLPNLQEYGITHVLTLFPKRFAPEIPPESGILHRVVEVEDDPLEDLLSLLDGLCKWIDDALMRRRTVSEQESVVVGGEGAEERKMERVLVHCLQGVSRSGAVVVAYVMRRLRIGYAEALAIARKDRDVITPNMGFAQQLRLWGEMEYVVKKEDGGFKQQYLTWKEDRDRVEDMGEEERSKLRVRSMGAMAARFGARRMEMKNRADGEGSGDTK